MKSEWAKPNPNPSLSSAFCLQVAYTLSDATPDVEKGVKEKIREDGPLGQPGSPPLTWKGHMDLRGFGYSSENGWALAIFRYPTQRCVLQARQP